MRKRIKNGVYLVLFFLSLFIVANSCKEDDKVFKKDPVITWANPSDIYFGTMLSANQLNATVDVHGTFVYTPEIGTKLNAGGNQDLRVEFIPTDLDFYNRATKVVKINVLPKKEPQITWVNPADIYFGAMLSAEQLNATVDVPGVFVYTPKIGTLLNEGENQDLRVDFMPTDFESYNGATKIVKINVLPALTLTDIDGHTYQTVTIGKQVWMAENLKVTKYRNGDVIPAEADYKWWNLTTGALCNYNDDPYLGNKYGKLYNWYAVNDMRKLAPAGWHIPSEAEWKELEDYLGANTGISGSIAKALASQTEWTYDNHGGAIGNDLTQNNSSGFSALPSGYRHNGAYLNFGNGICFWSSDEYDGSTAWRRYLGYAYNNLGSYNFVKVDGFSVRCIKD